MDHISITYNRAAGQGKAESRLPEVRGLLLAIHADGEIISTHGRSLDVECLPGQLSIIVPPKEP